MYPYSPIDIILLSCNRKENTEETIKQLFSRINYPYLVNLIVVDDGSIDGTYEMLESKLGLIRVLIRNKEHKNICGAYNEGFKKVESELFITMQDDITIPKLGPKDVIEQLVDLMNEYPDHAGIGLRIQRIPNLQVDLGDEKLIPARKCLSAYFRIQRKSDFDGREEPFGNRNYDDRAFVQIFKEEQGKGCSWTRNIWCDHSRGYCQNRNYNTTPRLWGMGHLTRMNQAIERKPYPRVDPDTCIPLPGECCFR